MYSWVGDRQQAWRKNERYAFASILYRNTRSRKTIFVGQRRLRTNCVCQVWGKDTKIKESNKVPVVDSRAHDQGKRLHKGECDTANRHPSTVRKKCVLILFGISEIQSLRLSSCSSKNTDQIRISSTLCGMPRSSTRERTRDLDDRLTTESILRSNQFLSCHGEADKLWLSEKEHDRSDVLRYRIHFDRDASDFSTTSRSFNPFDEVICGKEKIYPVRFRWKHPL